jgi:hypothetical protein
MTHMLHWCMLTDFWPVSICTVIWHFSFTFVKICWQYRHCLGKNVPWWIWFNVPTKFGRLLLNQYIQVQCSFHIFSPVSKLLILTPCELAWCVFSVKYPCLGHLKCIYMYYHWKQSYYILLFPVMLLWPVLSILHIANLLMVYWMTFFKTRLLMQWNNIKHTNGSCLTMLCEQHKFYCLVK